MDEDTLAWGKSEGREEAAEIIAEWLDVDPKWIQHVVDFRHNSGGLCQCNWDEDQGETFCDTYKPLTEAELQEREAQRKRAEAWDAINEASSKARREVMARYEEMGWLP